MKKWKYRINKISFVNSNDDEYFLRTKVKREFYTYEDFWTECKKLKKHGIKKYGEGTKLLLTYSHR